LAESVLKKSCFQLEGPLIKKPSTPTKQTAIEAVKAQLGEQILSGDLAPGARLRVDSLRLKFNVSTATMREALSRLLSDNLVTTESQRGFKVRELSRDDFRSISEARKIIEIGALRLSLANRNDNWEGDLFAAYRKLKLVENRLIADQNFELIGEWHLRNWKFHDCLVQNCQNPWLIDFRWQLHQQSDRYNRIALKDAFEHRDGRQEHAEIFESAIDGDVDACAAFVENHIAITAELIAKRL